MGQGALKSNRIAILQLNNRKIIYHIPAYRNDCEKFIIEEYAKKVKEKSKKIKATKQRKEEESAKMDIEDIEDIEDFEESDNEIDVTCKQSLVELIRDDYKDDTENYSTVEDEEDDKVVQDTEYKSYPQQELLDAKPIGLTRDNTPTCFINVSLQILFNIIPFDKLSENCCIDECIDKQQTKCLLGILLQQFQKIKRATSPISPEVIFDNIQLLQFKLTEQGCAREFISKFLCAFWEHSNEIGKIETTSTCNSCNMENRTEDPFYVLDPPFMKQNSRISDMLKEYCGETSIEDWMCGECKKTGCKQSKHVTKYPDILFIVIKSSSHWDGKKCNTDFQQLEPIFTTNNNDIFNLNSVIVHQGEDNYGHYLCFVKKNDIWWKINDASVREVDWNHVQSLKPSLLFYSKNSNTTSSMICNDNCDSQKEITILQENKELNDEIVNFRIGSIQSQEIYVCTSYIWNGICNVTSPNEDKINRLFKNVQKKKYIIFPCCTGINKTVGHWFLIIYSKEKQWILDSMENSDKIESIVYFIRYVKYNTSLLLLLT